jgi:hypothetical protein
MICKNHSNGGLRAVAVLPESGKGENNMQTIRKLLGFGEPADDISLRVLPIIHGGFGVYANTVLIAIHNDQASADEHCKRLRNQQVSE